MERQCVLMKTLLSCANWFWWIACYVWWLLYSEETGKWYYLRLLHFAIYSFVEAFKKKEPSNCFLQKLVNCSNKALLCFV